MSDMLSVERYGGFERGQACRRDRDVDGSTFATGSADKAAFAHSRQLMVQSALLPPEPLPKLNRTELVTVRLGEDGEHRVVGVREAAVRLEVLLDSAAQNLLQVVERPPRGLLAIAERSLRAGHVMGSYSVELTHQLLRCRVTHQLVDGSLRRQPHRTSEGDDMDTHAQQLAETYLKMLNTHEPDLVDRFVAEQYRNHNPFVADGREANGQFWTAFFGALPDLSATMEDLVISGDRVVGRFVYRGTHTGELMGIPASGNAVEMRSIDIWRVQDGMFVEHWDELNLLEVFQQVGAMPPSGGSPGGDL
jgi:steroid delta-isomerase-like uncharacterized protein